MAEVSVYLRKIQEQEALKKEKQHRSQEEQATGKVADKNVLLCI